MRVFAKKQRGLLSVIPRPVSLERAVLEVDANALEDSFHGWLHSVAPLRRKEPVASEPVFRIPRLTTLDVMRVNQATIREGESHCVWPPSVLEQFYNADVIRESDTEHYVLRDANLTRVQYQRRKRLSV